MGRALDAGKAHPDRTVLSNRFRSLRWILGTLLGLLGFIAVAGSEWNVWTVGSLAVLGGLYYLVTHTKRAMFDDAALYFVRGGKDVEKIPFKDITGIKATGMRINHLEVWRLEYKDSRGQAKKYRWRPRTIFEWPYSSTNIAGFPTDFNNAVQAVNPDVVIWWHYYFFHDQKWKP